MPRQKLCKICAHELYFEIETDIRRAIDARGSIKGVASEMLKKYGHISKYLIQWTKHITRHFVYEKAVRTIDEDEVLDTFIEKGYNELTATDRVPLRDLLSAISIKTKRQETKAKQDMTRAMITAFISGARKANAIDVEEPKRLE